jgi:hypothetical protein
MIKSNHIRRSPLQNDLATSTSSRSTSWTPRIVLISTGNSTNRITTTVLAVGPKPNHTTMIGISATLGVAYSALSGSSISVAKTRLRPAASPTASPIATPMTEPAPSTTRLSANAWDSVPSTIMSTNAREIALGEDNSTGLIARP